MSCFHNNTVDYDGGISQAPNVYLSGTCIWTAGITECGKEKHRVFRPGAFGVTRGLTIRYTSKASSLVIRALSGTEPMTVSATLPFLMNKMFGMDITRYWAGVRRFSSTFMA